VFQIELEFGSVGLRRGKTGAPGENPLRARERTNNKFKPHMASEYQEFGQQLVGGECSPFTSVSSLAPQVTIIDKKSSPFWS